MHVLFKKLATCLAIAWTITCPPPAAHAQNPPGLTTLYQFSTAVTTGYYPKAQLIKAKNGFLYGTTVNGGASGVGTVYEASAATGAITDLYDFVGGSADGGYPYGRLLQDSAGNTYGTCQAGGAHNLGVIFKIDTTGHESIIWNFAGYPSDGAYPYGGLILASDGKMYGVCYAGGSSNIGAIYKFDQTALTVTLLHSFTNNPDGAHPDCELTEGLDHNLYGVAQAGGVGGFGTAFVCSKAGDTTLYSTYSFTGYGSGSTGSYPVCDMVEDSSGNFYGLTQSGGASNGGVLYKMTYSSGFAVSAMHTFTGADGYGPYAGLILAADGNLYGTTTYGGMSGYGTVFKCSTAGTYSVIHSFVPQEAVNPYGGLVEYNPGTFFGASYQGGATASQNSDGDGSFYRVTSFGNLTLYGSFYVEDLADPYYGSMAQAQDGLFYGTCLYGGALNYGGIFRTDASGNLTIAHSLNDLAPFFDGYHPQWGVGVETNGTIYGTTAGGGFYGYGTLFNFSPGTRAFSVLHHFRQREGAYANLPMVASNGSFYGSCQQGGGANLGSLYSVTQGGFFSVIGYFNNTDPNGYYPVGQLVQKGAGGLLYGVCQNGGANNGGTFWSITLGGTFKLLHSFLPATDGYNPTGALLVASDGNIYGTCEYGGSAGYGSIFRWNPTTNTFSVLSGFSGASQTGYYPYGQLIQGPDGNLYGSTYSGGTSNVGTLFEANFTSGALSFPFSGFAASPNPAGARPAGGLVVGTDANLYGTALAGGASNWGTVFTLNTGLANAALDSSVLTATYTVSGTTATVTLKNTSSGNVVGPINAVILGLPGGVTVTNATGTVPAGYPVTGDPYVVAPFGDIDHIFFMLPGSVKTFTVTFNSAPGTGWSIQPWAGRF